MTNVFSMFWEVGEHTHFEESITKTILHGVRSGMYTIQCFIGDPKNAWKRNEIDEEDIKNTKKILGRFPMNVFTHYPFCANLAGQSAKGCLAWNGNQEVDRKLKGVLRALEYELGIVANFSEKRAGVVIHPGSYPDRYDGHITVSKTLNMIKFPKNSVLLLENCAGEGNKLCRNFEEIKIVIDLLNPANKPHVKVCVDTAHIWGQGDYDLRLVSEVDRMFKDFERLLGLEIFYLLHLNDSAALLGSKKDLHACLGEGEIWRDSFESLIHLLNKCKENNIPMVLETHGGDMITLAKIQPTLNKTQK